MHHPHTKSAQVGGFQTHRTPCVLFLTTSAHKKAALVVRARHIAWVTPNGIGWRAIDLPLSGWRIKESKNISANINTIIRTSIGIDALGN